LTFDEFLHYNVTDTRPRLIVPDDRLLIAATRVVLKYINEDKMLDKSLYDKRFSLSRASVTVKGTQNRVPYGVPVRPRPPVLNINVMTALSFNKDNAVLSFK